MLVGLKDLATVDSGQRETRFWLQILSLHGYIFSSLNSIRIAIRPVGGKI